MNYFLIFSSNGFFELLINKIIQAESLNFTQRKHFFSKKKCFFLSFSLELKKYDIFHTKGSGFIIQLRYNIKSYKVRLETYNNTSQKEIVK